MRTAKIVIVIVSFVLLVGVGINYAFNSSRHQGNLGSIRDMPTGGIVYNSGYKEARYWGEQDRYSSFSRNSLIASGLIIVGAGGAVIVLNELEKKDKEKKDL